MIGTTSSIIAVRTLKLRARPMRVYVNADRSALPLCAVDGLPGLQPSRAPRIRRRDRRDSFIDFMTAKAHDFAGYDQPSVSLLESDDLSRRLRAFEASSTVYSDLQRDHDSRSSARKAVLSIPEGPLNRASSIRQFRSLQLGGDHRSPNSGSSRPVQGSTAGENRLLSAT